MTSPDPTLASVPRTNAWDNHSSIDAYVRAVQSQSKVGKVQVLFNTEGPSATTGNESDINPAQQPNSPARRRESLILTDFPTELERPSLPVTPAPIRRPSFWGSERDDAGELPSAEGVPDQSEWDPHAQLEALRRSSVLAAQGDMPEGASGADAKELPKRDMVETAAPMPMVKEQDEKVAGVGVDVPVTAVQSSGDKVQAATAEEMSMDEAYFLPKA